MFAHSEDFRHGMLSQRLNQPKASTYDIACKGMMGPSKVQLGIRKSVSSLG
jgi:hypothetical protein